MNTLINRANERFQFLTIIFETREEAEKNASEDMGDIVVRANVAMHGHNGFVIQSCDGYKELIRLAV